MRGSYVHPFLDAYLSLMSFEYRLYYRYEHHRLAFCKAIIHGLLHVADNIEACGPASKWWSFVMERVGGILKHRLKSRVRPYQNLLLRIVGVEQLRQLEFRCALQDVLHPKRDSNTTKPEDAAHFFEAGLPTYIPLPARKEHTLTDEQARRIGLVLNPALRLPLGTALNAEERQVIGWSGCRLGDECDDRVITEEALNSAISNGGDVTPRDCSYILVSSLV